MFSQYFFAFLKSAWNFEHLQKRIEPHNLNISRISRSEKRGYLNE